MNNLPKTSVILATGVIFLTMMLTIMSIPVDLRAQSSTLSEIYEQGMEAKERGEFEQAFLIWEKAGKQPGYAIGREYLKLAAELAQKEKYETATHMYYRGLSEPLSHPADQRAFNEDLLHLELLMKPDEFEEKFELVKSDDAELQKAVRLFWESADPLPAETVNPRLIEHYGRISEAHSKFPDESSPLGFDDRGKMWVRFGKPDKKQNIDLQLSRGEIYNFVSDFFALVDNSGTPCKVSLTANINNTSNINDRPNIESKGIVNSSPIVYFIETEINSKSFLNSIDIWIYQLPESENNSLVYYFKSGQDHTFKQIDAIDEIFSPSLFTWNRSKCEIGNLTSGLAIQYVTYKRLIGFDSYFTFAFNKIDTDIFSPAGTPSAFAVRNFATKLKAENQVQAFRNLSSAPPESSTEKEKIPAIPLEVFQYRLLDTDDEPVLATFVESRPAAAFLADLTAGQEQMIPDGEADITDEISRWYSLSQGVDLRDASGGLAGRLRSAPQLNLDEQDRTPSVSLFNIPYLSEEAVQQFYVMLENRHPQSKPREESVFPDELRGLGRAAIPQPEQLDLSGDHPVLGDLILGYGRMESIDQPLRFPFVASHDRSIPEGENLVVHFEVYRLQTGPQEFASFEADYEILPKQGLFGRLLKNKDKLSGTLSFEPRDNRFAESLEFEELNLEPGSYELTWAVRDLVSGEQAGQSVEFEVVERE